ncbi:MAG: pyridoxal phosphate-dependent aminotransferase [Flavobacteriales bacterium]|nr:pyridoxal phosphate-dependent aminotransferase [Flavobacteriales bacterium]
MDKYLSQRIKKLSESQTIAMARRSRELQAEGIDVISLSLGEPDLNAPDHVKEAAKKAIDDNWSHYPPVAGYPDLRKAICEKFKRENGLEYKPDQIVVSTGAKQSLANVILSLVDPGDEVVILAPYWVSYLELVKLAGGKAKFVTAGIETDFKSTADELEEAINDDTKLVIFSSPSNPTGSFYTKEELAGFAKVISRNPRVFAIADEIYEHLNFIGKHESLAQFPEVYDQVITVNGVSKAYAMTGYRIGYIGAPLWIAKACDKMQGQITSGACSIAQRATIAALETPQDWLKDMCDLFQTRRDLVTELFSNIEGFKTNMPGGAFYLFPEVSALFGHSFNGQEVNDGNDLCMYFLNECHVAMVPGEAFGAPNYIRLSYATSETNLKEAARRIKIGVEKLLHH